MRKVDFPQKNSKALSETAASRARETLQRNKGLFRNDADIIGYTVAAKDFAPYIQVFVRPGRGVLVQERIPDRIEDLDVYYTEASPRALC